VSFVAITLFVASQRVFIFVGLYFEIDSVRKLLVTSRTLRFNEPNLLRFQIRRRQKRRSEARSICPTI
jgi:hypothetical protein